jgi:type IX secretion system PorP/SprF family membrane protein
MKKIIVLLVCLWIGAIGMEAQNTTQFSQYTFNKINFNPALTGAYEALTFSGFYRQQWFGVEGAPRTGMLNVIAPLTRHNTILGMSLSYDQIGMTQTGLASASYAYKLKFNNGLQVVGGLVGHLEYGRIDWSQANVANPGDIQLGEGMDNTMNPNFGAGVSVNAKHWYLGLSMPRFLKSFLFQGGNPSEQANRPREFYVMGGFDVTLAPNLRLRPGGLITYNPSAPFDFALDASLLMYNQFIIGGAYRLDDAATAFMQYRLNPQWKMGFAYDFTLSELNNYSNGTAEIMLEYTLDRVMDGTRHIRFF